MLQMYLHFFGRGYHLGNESYLMHQHRLINKGVRPL